MNIKSVLFFVVLTLVMSCSNESGPDIPRMIGVVLDYDTKEPVPEAQVSTIPASEVILADEYGRFEIRTPEEGEFSVIARHSDYITAKEQIAVSYDYNSLVTIYMRKQGDSSNYYGDYAIISGIITDAETEEPIENVLISLVPGSDMTNSDNSGKYSFEVFKFDTYELQFEKSGYKTVNESIEVKDFIDHKLNIEMEKGEGGNFDKEPPFFSDAIYYWSFDDHAIEEINYKDPVIKNEIQFFDGVLGKAVYLGNYGFIQLPDTDFNSIGEFTISLWVKQVEFAHSNGGGYLFCGSLEEGYLGILNAIKPLPVKTDNKTYLYFATGAMRDVYSQNNDVNPLFLDYQYHQQWTYYTMTYKDGILKAYINGEYQSKINQTLDISDNTFLLGAHKIGVNDNSVVTRVNALYDELVIYNKEMSETEIKQIYEYY